MRNDEARRCNPTRPLGHVAVVGGTHGNERMGIAIVDDLHRSPPTASFELEVLLANERAAAARGTGAGLRYVDTDLNRCFLRSVLSRDGEGDAYEERRAREIDARLGPKKSPSPRCDLILDLHSTTANTGILLCMHPRDEFALQLAAHLTSLDGDIRIAFWPDSDDVPLLPTVARSGLTVEVGPCAHSTVNSRLLHRTRRLILDALAYVDTHNSRLADQAATAARREATVDVHQSVAALDYPRDGGRVTGYIHPDLQGIPELREPLEAGARVFEMLDGSPRALSEVVDESLLSEPLFPFFVNEAAYYEKGVACNLARRFQRTVRVWE